MITEVSSKVAELIRAELPEIELISSNSMREQLVRLWADFLRESTYSRIGDAPAFPGLERYDLATHTRHVVRNGANPIRVADGGTTKFLDDERHDEQL